MSEIITRFKADRVRAPRHLARLRTLPCCIPGCKGKPTIAHHLTCGPEPKARGLKASDRFAVNLCEPIHHSAQSNRGIHHRGDEAAWWAEKGLDPVRWAEYQWRISRALGLVP